MTKFVKVDEWDASKHTKYIWLDGKTLVMPFDEIFGRKIDIGRFIIKKISFINRMNDYETSNGVMKGVCHYINYFINEYDDDGELVVAYLKLKYLTDRNVGEVTAEEFRSVLYSTLLSDRMIELINKMCEDNYYIDITPKKTKDFEQLEFNNEHAKIMMKISTAMKLMIAPMMHFINTNNLNKKELIYSFFFPLFKIFEKEDSDVYAKLWYTVQSRVQSSVKRDTKMWDQHEVYGSEPTEKAEKLLREDIITETMFRYTFNGSVVNLNTVIIRTQIGFIIRTKYDHNLVEVSSAKNAEGLSGIDKLEMNSYKIDESLMIMTELNTKQVIDQLCESIGMTIKDDEIDFYAKHMGIHKMQSEFVFYYFAKYLGYNDLRLLTKKNYIRLVIILRRTLDAEGFTYLPIIFSSNVIALSKRAIRNQKFASRIEASDVYKNLMKYKFPALKEIGKEDFILKQLSMFINSTFSIVDYDHPERLGEMFDIDIPDVLSGEILEYLNMI